MKTGDADPTPCPTGSLFDPHADNAPPPSASSTFGLHLPLGQTCDFIRKGRCNQRSSMNLPPFRSGAESLCQTHHPHKVRPRPRIRYWGQALRLSPPPLQIRESEGAG